MRPDPVPIQPRKLGDTKRKKMTVTSESLVKLRLLTEDQRIPLVIEPAIEGVDALDWARSNRELIDLKLVSHGALLFRNFPITTVDAFEKFLQALCRDELLEYRYASTPRGEVRGRIYTSTDYPADQHIPLHNEMSYARTWPMKIWFCCLQAAERGGQTPLADSRRVFQRIRPAIRETFARKGVQYVRNYGGGLDLSWQKAFRTDERSRVEDFCRDAGILLDWNGEDRLRTVQVCQAVATHPKTAEQVWFNQAHLFHLSSLDPEIRNLLQAEIRESELPRNAYYGDGSAIDPADLEEIRKAYQEEAIRFDWQKGDVLFLDNMLIAHGRTPFQGERQILVGMAESYGETKP